MMGEVYSLEDAYTSLTKEDILARVSEEQLWRRYCTNFKQIGRPFLSELYNDTTPSCYVFAYGNRLIYKDFGANVNYDIIGYIQTKYIVSFKEALRIIASDFFLGPGIGQLPNKVVTCPEPTTPHKKSVIEVIKQGYTLYDKEYWGQYYIDLTLLFKYNIYSAKKIYLIKPEKTITFDYSKNNPIYAYEFVHEGSTYYKIYKPLAEKRYKFLFNGFKECIEGFDQLPPEGDLLVITKAMKDVLVYRTLGYNAISLQGEGNTLDETTAEKIEKRFKKILVNYDPDETGIKGATQITERYGFPHFFIPEEKDLSDYIKKNGKDKTKEMLDERIKQL
jgi:hypothetical protein